MHHYGPMFRLLHSTISQGMSNALSAMELTSSQGHIMGYLSVCREPPCPKDIEEELRLSHPTVSGLLSRLEKKDFIRIEPDPGDGRCKRIYVQPKGAACHQKMRAAIEEIEQQIVRDFTEEEKQQFAEFLCRAVKNVGGFPFQVDSREETET